MKWQQLLSDDITITQRWAVCSLTSPVIQNPATNPRTVLTHLKQGSPEDPQVKSSGFPTQAATLQQHSWFLPMLNPQHPPTCLLLLPPALSFEKEQRLLVVLLNGCRVIWITINQEIFWNGFCATVTKTLGETIIPPVNSSALLIATSYTAHMAGATAEYGSTPLTE